MDPQQQNELTRLLAEQNNAMAALINKLKEENQQLEERLRQEIEEKGMVLEKIGIFMLEQNNPVLAGTEASIAKTETRIATTETLLLEIQQRENKRRLDDRRSLSKQQRQLTRSSKLMKLKLLETAKAVGIVKTGLSAHFFDELSLRRQCDHCHCACSAKLSYTCSTCEDFDTCSTCWDQGRRCFDEDHTDFARRSLIGTAAGRCRRALRPSTPTFGILCNLCEKIIEGIFYHCCHCSSDDFDICFSCVLEGKTCFQPTHFLQLFRGRPETY
ncbi:hypothetical protein HD806DRAFT_526941 [Xylariaceae sp. AK1471]|nr:hypothetical protein HD806DRAFT_526941 [Xylariaceae sp. AK1471]